MTTTALDSLLQGLTSINPATTTVVSANSPSYVGTQPIVLMDMALPLFDYQREAVEHALRDAENHPYAYLGLDMGLGKTPCALAISKALVTAGIRKVLIVVPPSLRVNWKRELAKFTPDLKTGTVTTTKPDEGEVMPDLDVIIIGDSSLTGWADFLTGQVGALIVDEAHRFKNKSKRSDALVQIATGYKRIVNPVTKQTQRVKLSDTLPRMRVLMSGTPTPNGRNNELATQIDVLGDKAWKDVGGKGMFWHHYAPQVDAWGGRGNNDSESLFQSMSSSWFFRRLRGDVLDLPNKGRTALHLEGTGRAVKEYKLAEEDLIQWLAGKHDGKVTDGQRRAKALIKMLALRKLAGEAKVKSLVEHTKELLESQPGGVFIVAEHSDVMDNLLIGLAKYNPMAVRGGMSDNDKAFNIDEFCNGNSRVLVGQIISAGVGLTLHGGGINHHVIIAQLPWTPADLRQAEDRLHRIGQTNDVMVEVALCAIDGSWTIDERLWGMLEAKNFNSTTLTDGLGEYLLSEVQEGLLDSYR